MKGTDVSCGRVLSDYVGSGLPSGTGLDLYDWLVYMQDKPLNCDKSIHSQRSPQQGQGGGLPQEVSPGSPGGVHVSPGRVEDYLPNLYEQLSGKWGSRGGQWSWGPTPTVKLCKACCFSSFRPTPSQGVLS
ncbi:Phosphatidylethanolamine-binding protein 1 [Microtus ochrogaster]|uniref:Phosphatidylethanolamine-binding protein 1 n=1 Tax=Microtus ochrogaster TaxID=79684 RepID=A0A8J6GTQ6_MICOH|nr:Phosphatidylethanolamine-binding protein 1 [Microtus ochrogaster]